VSGKHAFLSVWSARAALVLVSSVATAQEPVGRISLVELRDSLDAVSDTSLLRARFKQSRHSNPFRAGWIGLRLGALGADRDFSDARSMFRRAARNRSQSALAWYGMGLAETARAREEMRDVLRLGSRVGLGTLERALEHYSRAVDADPRFIPAAIELAGVALSLLDTARLREAQQVLRRAVESVSPVPPELALDWGRVERSAGSLQIASLAFERYLLNGGNRALGLLELARTRLALGAADGEAPYYEGAALDDPRATAGYRADLEAIAADSNLQEFDRLNGQRRAAFLHRFWTDRDHLELRPEGERLREHYRRLLYARRHFPLTVSRRFYGRLDAYRSGSTELDDRGIIYIRQGEPSERLRPFIFGAMPNESWRYERAEGDLLFHFSSGYDRNGGGDLYDYRLVQSVLDIRGASDMPPDQLILSRQSLSPIYSRMLNWGTYGAANERARERNIGMESILVGTTTDNSELRFKRRLGAVADLIAVGRRSGASLAHFVFGIAAPGTVWNATTNGVDYPVRVRLVALDRHDRAVATLDTSLVVHVRQPLSKKEFVVGRVEIGLPAGRWTYRAALQQGDSAGVVLPRDSVLVAHAGENSLSLSDIALGSPRRAVAWVTDAADTVLLAPSALFRERSEVQIYYEARGVRPGQYRHEIAVLRPEALEDDGERPPLVALAFEERATGPVLRSRRTVRLDRLKRGSYVVEVRLTGPDGQFQVRRRPIQLIGR
jgi:GWxTD domain-containing protein